MARSGPRSQDTPWGRAGQTRNVWRKAHPQAYYAYRIEQGQAQGKTRTEARGHGGKIVGPKKPSPKARGAARLRGQAVELAKYRTERGVMQALRKAYDRTKRMEHAGPFMVVRFGGVPDPSRNNKVVYNPKNAERRIDEPLPPPWVQPPENPYAIPIPEDVPDDDKIWFPHAKKRYQVEQALEVQTFTEFVEDRKIGIDQPEQAMRDLFLWVTDVHFINSTREK